MFYTTPTSKLKQNWQESSSFLAFSWKRKRETNKGKAMSSNLDLAKTRLVTLECEKTCFCPFQILMCHLLNNFLCIFVFQVSKSLAKEVLHSQRRNVYISSLTGKSFLNKQQDFAGILDRFACVINPETSFLYYGYDKSKGSV